jgi:hypothetical protein
VSIGYFLIFAVLWRFFSFGYCLFSGGIFLFSVVFVGGDSCVFYLVHLSLVCLFWVCESLEVSLAGRVIFSVCVGLRCVECRSGTIYLSASLGWVAGLYRFFLFGSVVVSMVRFISVLAGGGRRGCTGFLLVLLVGFVFSNFLILF